MAPATIPWIAQDRLWYGKTDKIQPFLGHSHAAGIALDGRGYVL
jgi:hypothetical protein